MSSCLRKYVWTYQESSLLACIRLVAFTNAQRRLGGHQGSVTEASQKRQGSVTEASRKRHRSVTEASLERHRSISRVSLELHLSVTKLHWSITKASLECHRSVYFGEFVGGSWQIFKWSRRSKHCYWFKDFSFLGPVVNLRIQSSITCFTDSYRILCIICSYSLKKDIVQNWVK